MYKIDHITLNEIKQQTGGASQADLDALKVRVQNNETHLNQNDGKITSLEVNVGNLQNKDAELERQIQENDNAIDSLNTNYDLLENIVDTKLPTATFQNEKLSFAIKNEENTFTNRQIIHYDNDCFKLRNQNSNTPCWMGVFNRNDYVLSKYGRVDTSEKIYLTSEIEDLVLKAPANKIVDITHNNVLVKEPTANEHATTKNYVDTAIAGIQLPSLTDYAKKNEVNEFTQQQILKDGANFELVGDRNADTSFIRFNMDGVGNNKEIHLFNVWQGGIQVRMSYNKANRGIVEAHGTFNYNNSVRFKTQAFNSNAPTHNEHLTNKAYVDGIKTKVKECAANATTFDEFKTAIGNW